jgi:monoamine oxidase
LTILVVGAGLAGLAAARALERRGLAARVIEARDRVGGRVWTIRDGFAAGQFAEAGADLIEADHHATLGLARELGLHPTRILRHGFGFYGASPRGRVEIQSMAHGFRTMAEPLGALIEAYRHGEQRWDGGIAARLAAQSVAGWLRDLRAPEWLVQRFRGLRGLFLADIEDLSLLALVDFFDGASPGAGEMFRLREGNDRLATGIVRELEQPPLLSTSLESVVQSDAGVTAAVRDRSGRHELTADRLVLTVPGSLVRSIAFDPPLPDAQREAYAALRMGCATRTLLQFDRRFWVSRRRPRAFGSDRAHGAVWDASEGQRGRAGILSLLGGGRGSAALQSLLASGSTDALVDSLRWLGRPGRLLASRTVVWDDDPWARGGYVYFHAGGRPDLRDALARPHGRVLFAGEHTSIRWQGYVNGAIESGLRAAAEI